MLSFGNKFYIDLEAYLLIPPSQANVILIMLESFTFTQQMMTAYEDDMPSKYR